MKNKLKVGQVWYDYDYKYSFSEKVDYYVLLLSKGEGDWNIVFLRKDDRGYLGSITTYLSEDKIRKMQYIGDFNPENCMIFNKEEEFKKVDIEPELKGDNIRTTDNTWENLI